MTYSVYRPVVAFYLCRSQCPVALLAREAFVHAYGRPFAEDICETDGLAALAIRVLRVNAWDGDSQTEMWVRVSGRKQLVEGFIKALTRAKGIYFQQVYANNYGRVLRILLPRDFCIKCLESMKRPVNCGCPLLTAPVGAMAKTTIITPCGVVFEVIAAKRGVLEGFEKSEWNCKLIYQHGIDEYDYMLTEKQEQVLIEAYLRGYFSFPRKISMKDLAKELGLSISSLAEHLRKAEAKVIEAFIRHEMPHYLVMNVLRNGRLSVFRSEEKAGRRNAIAEAIR